MFTIRALVVLVIVISSSASARSQQVQHQFVWDNNLSNCGSNSGAISCVVTFGDYRELTFLHKTLTISMSHGWARENLGIIVTVKNASDVRLPIDVEQWTLTAYKTIEDLIADRDPILKSRAKKPLSAVNSGGMLNTSTSGLPSNAPLQREVTRNQTTNPSTGQIINPNTKVITPNPAGSSISVSPSSRRRVGKRFPSATKWTDIADRTTQTGEARFPIKSDRSYVAISLNINGTDYIYRLRRSR